MRRNSKLFRVVAVILALILCGAMIILSLPFAWAQAGLGGDLYVYAAEAEDSNKAKISSELDFMGNLIIYIQSTYKDKVDAQQLLDGAYNGIFETLDKYSVYYSDRAEADSFMENATGEFSGVGLRLQEQDGKCVVQATIPNTPAEVAKIQSGDVVTKVNGADVTGKTVSEIASLLKGEEGTSVTVTVTRGTMQITSKLKRAIIEVDSVSGEMMEGNIGYISLDSFDRDSATEFEKMVLNLQDQGAKSFIVDVRNNSGGLLQAAVDIASGNMTAGPVCYLVQQGKDIYTHSADGWAYMTGPVVLLVNENTASAAEILAGAWKDTKKATLVGNTTFGKGVAQTVINLKNGAAMKLSNCYFYTPKRNVIDQKGITPDYVVPMGSSQTAEERQAAYAGFAPMVETISPKAGDTGLNVYGGQQRLKMLGYELEVTGTMDKATVDAVEAFQKNAGLYSYGVLDRTTQAELETQVLAFVQGSEQGDPQLEKAVELLKK